MTKTFRRAIPSMLVLCWLPATAAADPITLQLFREVGTVAVINSSRAYDKQQNQDQMTAFGMVTDAGDRAAAFAEMSSSIAGGRVAGLSEEAVEARGVAFSRAYLNLIWSFVLDRPYFYDFVGSFDSTGVSSISRAGWSAVLGPIPYDGMHVPAFDYHSVGPEVAAAHGVLAAGRYGFRVAGEAVSSTNGSSTNGHVTSEFTFALTPTGDPAVPEPASMLLIGTGLAGLFAGRHHLRS